MSLIWPLFSIVAKGYMDYSRNACYVNFMILVCVYLGSVYSQEQLYTEKNIDW